MLCYAMLKPRWTSVHHLSWMLSQFFANSSYAKMACTEFNSDENVSKTFTIEASVPTGFESVAAEEAKEMFGTECRAIRGKITFQTPAGRLKDILKLGGIDHCRVQILHLPCFSFTEDGDDCLSGLQLLVKQCDWSEGLEVWRQFHTFPHPIPHTPATIPTDEELIDICHSVHMPGHRSGERSTCQGKKKDRKQKGGRRGRGGVRDRGKGQQREGKKESTPERENWLHGAATNAEVMDENGKLDDSTLDKGVSDNNDLNGQMSDQQLCGGAEAESSEVQVVESAANTCHVPDKDHPNTNAQSPMKKLTGNGVEVVCARTSEGSSTSQPDPASHSVCGIGDMMNSATPCREKEKESESSTDLQDHHIAGDSVVNHDSREKDSSNQYSSPAKKVIGEEDTPGIKPDAAKSSPAKKLKRPVDPTKPSFRVTCKRSGENHSFDSMSAAASFGSAVQTYFGWSVDMTHYNIEVMLTIDNNEVSVGLTLTPESLHRRNLVAFGVTTLRPTICHNMLRMVKIHPGHVVCDPLCGTASISIQGALSFPAFQLCGDNHTVAMEKTHSNHTALNAKRRKNDKGALMMDAVQWDACRLPLRDGIVDVFVSDLPFGKRVGKKFGNLKLYCSVLDETARCGKQTARAALLTGDINNMVKAIQTQRYWTRRRCYSCNIGGIPAAVFLLCRNPTPYTPSPRNPHHHPNPPSVSTDETQPADSNSLEQAKTELETAHPEQSESQLVC